MKYIKSIGIPIMYYILVETDEENDELVILSGKEMLADLTEENWEDQFEYGNSVLEFEGIDWLAGAYAHTVEEREESDDITEETEDGTSESSGEVRDPVGDVQGARERDEGLPM
jgi:hypothetical protein